MFRVCCPALSCFVQVSKIDWAASHNRPAGQLSPSPQTIAGPLEICPVSSGVLRCDPAWCAIDMIRQSLLWICAEGWCWKHLTWKFDVTRKVEAVVHNLNWISCRFCGQFGSESRGWNLKYLHGRCISARFDSTMKLTKAFQQRSIHADLGQWCSFVEDDLETVARNPSPSPTKEKFITSIDIHWHPSSISKHNKVLVTPIVPWSDSFLSLLVSISHHDSSTVACFALLPRITRAAAW